MATDAEIRARGIKYLPLQKYLQKPYEFPVEETPDGGITNTNAFTNSGDNDQQFYTGGTNAYTNYGVSDFQSAVGDRQDRLNKPIDTSKFMGKIKGFMNPQSADQIMAEGYKPQMKLGILANILPDKYGTLPRADQAFIAQNMGYTGPTVFGENTGNQDIFGTNVRSAFGNYADFVDKKALDLTNTLGKGGKIAEKYGVSYDPVTGKFTGTDEDIEIFKKQNKLNLTKLDFYRGKKKESQTLRMQEEIEKEEKEQARKDAATAQIRDRTTNIGDVTPGQQAQANADYARIQRAYREDTGGDAGSYGPGGSSGQQSDGSYNDPFDPGGGEKDGGFIDGTNRRPFNTGGRAGYFFGGRVNYKQGGRINFKGGGMDASSDDFGTNTSAPGPGDTGGEGGNKPSDNSDTQFRGGNNPPTNVGNPFGYQDNTPPTNVGNPFGYQDNIMKSVLGSRMNKYGEDIEEDINNPYTMENMFGITSQVPENTKLVGLNKKQTGYLDTVGKKIPTALGTTDLFTYDSPADIKKGIESLNTESDSGFFSKEFDPDKITYGDKNTYATDQDVENYMKEKFGLTIPTGGTKIGLAYGGRINFKGGGADMGATDRAQEREDRGYGSTAPADDRSSQQQTDNNDRVTGRGSNDNPSNFFVEDKTSVVDISGLKSKSPEINIDYTDPKNYASLKSRIYNTNILDNDNINVDGTLSGEIGPVNYDVDFTDQGITGTNLTAGNFSAGIDANKNYNVGYANNYNGINYGTTYDSDGNLMFNAGVKFKNGGRARYAEGGPIYSRLGTLSSGVQSAEQQLQSINASLQKAESDLGGESSGGGSSLSGGPSFTSNFQDANNQGPGSNLLYGGGSGGTNTPGLVGDNTLNNTTAPFGSLYGGDKPIKSPMPVPGNPELAGSVSSIGGQDPARQAYEKAMQDAKKQRADGMMGRVVLPGEMSFEDFSGMYNSKLSGLQPLPSTGGGLGGFFPGKGGMEAFDGGLLNNQLPTGQPQPISEERMNSLNRSAIGNGFYDLNKGLGGLL